MNEETMNPSEIVNAFNSASEEERKKMINMRLMHMAGLDEEHRFNMLKMLGEARAHLPEDDQQKLHKSMNDTIMELPEPQKSVIMETLAKIKESTNS